MSSSLVYILPTYVQGLLPFYVSVVDTTPQQTRPNKAYCLYSSSHRPYTYTSVYYVFSLSLFR